jgi:hypothetical protein
MVTAIDPFLSEGVFKPEEVHDLAVAFDDICREMDLPIAAIVAREVVATRVIDLARDGLIDPAQLKERVLHEVSLAHHVATESEIDRPSAQFISP